MPDMLTALEEEADVYEVFPPHVDTSGISVIADSPTKKPALKSLSEVLALVQTGRKKELKQAIRENAWPINSTIRSQLWPVLCRQHAHDKNLQEGFYWDMVNQLFGTTEISDKPIMLPPFVEQSHCIGYHLTRKGRNIADRVMSVLGYACPDITYSPALYAITAILLHFMTEEECYNSMACLIACKDKVFITQTKQLYEVTWRTVMLISKKHTKSAAAHLTRHCKESRADRIYSDWLWWILKGLPFNHLVRVIDCFLNEGIKVFYRMAMAIVLLFHKHSSQQNSEWMNEITINGIDAALLKFCKQMPMPVQDAEDSLVMCGSFKQAHHISQVSPSKLLRTAFSIRALSSAYIQRVFLKTEMMLKSKQVVSGSRQLVRSRSTDNLPTSQSQVNIQMMSRTLTIRELLALWSWLPVRITMYQPILLYTTEEHGCSLTTFYLRVEMYEPTLLMIKTCSGEVFGAYCSSRWYERNTKDEHGNRQAYFGTGETFLFSLYPERAKYPWVGIDSSQEDPSLKHAAELFMAAGAKMITIGGGDGQAIWMDENIRFGKTDRCLTFNNPPLCNSGDFEIRVLEVYGFVGA